MMNEQVNEHGEVVDSQKVPFGTTGEDKIYDEGLQAAVDGLEVDDNPYPVDSYGAAVWLDGYLSV